jgi:N-acyl-D-amino-acid deacylase
VGLTLFDRGLVPVLANAVLRTGEAHPALKSFDELMPSFLGKHSVPGASLAVARKGNLVYARGFGYTDLAKKVQVQPRSLFRIASISKPFTAVAALQCVEAGKIRLHDNVLDHVKLTPHLGPGAHFDPRWKKITIHHLLQHTGGWDRDKSFDPIGIPWDIARSLGIQPPIKPVHIIRYMLGKPLDFDPGAFFAYSNLGYLLLGRVIQAALNRPYEEVVRKQVLAPLGIKDMQLGRALVDKRARGEVQYYDPTKRTGPCLYPPHLGDKVPLPDGADNLEAYEAHGGWIASAVDLVNFASAFEHPARCPILQENAIETMWAPPAGAAGHTENGKVREAYYGCGWQVRPIDNKGKANVWHSGFMPGTSSLLVHRFDDLAWAVLFNTDSNPKGEKLADLIDPLLHEAADAVGAWPEGTAFEGHQKHR